MINQLQKILKDTHKQLNDQNEIKKLVKDANSFLFDAFKKMNNHEQENNNRASRQLKKITKINQVYAENIGALDKLITEKKLDNKNYLAEEQISKENDLKEITLNYRNNIKNKRSEIDNINKKYQDDLMHLELHFNRQVNLHEKAFNDAKNLFAVNTKNIEEETSTKINYLNKKYNDKEAEIKEKNNLKAIEINNKINEIEEEREQYIKEVDQNYYDIKSNYSKHTIYVNEKINEENSLAQNHIKNINNENSDNISPLKLSLLELDKEFKQKQNELVDTFSNKLKSLNVVFDLKKEQYEQNRLELTKKHTDKISAFNSQLSSYRDELKKEMKKTPRQQAETINEEIKLLKRTSKKDDATFKLNQAIIANDKAILNEKRDYHKQLFNLEQNHLKEINDWRFKKGQYEYEYRQTIIYYEKILNLKTQEINYKIDQLNYLKDYKTKSLQTSLSLLLLPADFQIKSAHLVQDRELNILDTEAQYKRYHLDFLKNKLNYELTVFELENNNELKQFENKYNYDKKVVAISNQLLIEKERMIRNYAQKEYNLRKELTEKILNLEREKLINNLDLDVFVINKEIDMLNINYQYLREKYRRELQFLYKVNNNKLNRLELDLHIKKHNFSKEKNLNLNICEVTKNQNNINYFFSYYYTSYEYLKHIHKLIDDLHNTPHKPTSFKQFTVYSIQIFNKIFEYLNQKNDDFLNDFQTYYDNKINEISGYVFILKNEEILNEKNKKIDLIKTRIKNIELDSKDIENNIKNLRIGLEKYNNLLIKHKREGNKKRTYINKETIKNISSELKILEKQITKNNVLINAHNKKINGLITFYDLRERSLKKKNINSKYKYYDLKNKNKSLIENFNIVNNQLAKQFSNILKMFSNDNFSYTEQRYLENNKQLTLLFKKFNKKIVSYHQYFLNNFKKLYLLEEKENYKLYQNFISSNNSIVKKGQKNLALLYRQHSQEENLKTKQLNQMIEKNKAEVHNKQINFEQVEAKNISLNKEKINNFEKQILLNENSSNNSIDILMTNLESVISQYKKEYDILEKNRVTKYNLEKKSLLKSINKKTKILKNHNKNTNVKVLNLINRHDQDYKKYRQHIKERETKLNYELKNYKDTYNQKTKNNVYKLKQLQLLQIKLNKKLEKNLISFKKSKRKSQNKQYRQEFSELKKSYRFKIRHLNVS